MNAKQILIVPAVALLMILAIYVIGRQGNQTYVPAAQVAASFGDDETLGDYETVEMTAEEFDSIARPLIRESIIERVNEEGLTALEAAQSVLEDHGTFLSDLFYEYLEKALREDPFKALILRGFANLNMEGDFPAAKDDFAAAVKMDPQSTAARKWLAMMLVGNYEGVEVDPDEAIMHLEKAIELGDSDYHVRTIMAGAYRIKGEQGKELRYLKEALEFEPEFPLLKRAVNKLEEAGIKEEQ